MPKLLSSQEIVEVFTRFKRQNSNPKSELNWSSPFTLLVAVVLSAQATDKSVNLATEELYKVADTPQKILELGEEGLIFYIKSIGLYKSKAKHVIGLCKKLILDFDGKVPRSREDLMSLPGVGRKTANVVLNVVWGEHTMPAPRRKEPPATQRRQSRERKRASLLPISSCGRQASGSCPA